MNSEWLLMTTFYLHPKNANKNKDQLRLGLDVFLEMLVIYFIGLVGMSFGFLMGCIVFSLMAHGIGKFSYNFNTYGTDTTATVTYCEMGRGRGAIYPIITFVYTIDGQPHSNTLMAQGRFEDCMSLPANNIISIVYFSNEPESSLLGSWSEHSNGFVILFILVGAISFAVSSGMFFKQALFFVPAIRLWQRQESYLQIISGEIVCVTNVKEKRRDFLEIDYHFVSSDGRPRIQQVKVQRHKYPQGSLPRPHMRVIMLYINEKTVSLA